jgi:hypothetical protein
MPKSKRHGSSAPYLPILPTGFAASESGWQTIQRSIDSCDYYVVIVAGIYGSLRPDGLSFTESEYDYARKIGKPILASLFDDLHRLPMDRVEPTEEGRAKLAKFRDKLMNDRLCQFWMNEYALVGGVLEGLNRATETHPLPGWIRGVSPVAPDGPIFVVHGHDHANMHYVVRVLQGSTGRDIVVLHEKPNAGRTILEKFEHHAMEAAYAVVLLTADDEGGLAGGVTHPRARQNVIFELGFFFGRLGRRRVAVLIEEGVEKPSHVDGLPASASAGPGASSRPVVADTVVADTGVVAVSDAAVSDAAVSDAAGKAVAAGVAGHAPEPYVPGSGDRVPAKLRLVLAGYACIACLSAGGIPAAGAVSGDDVEYQRASATNTVGGP